MRRHILIALLAPLGFLTVNTAFAAKSANGPLLKLFDTTWQEDLADDPLSATQLGDSRYNDKLQDMSAEGIDRRNKKNFTRLQTLVKMNRDKLEKADQLNYDLFYREIKGRIDVYQFKPWSYAITTYDGPQMFSGIIEYAPFNTAHDYDNWIARLNASGVYFDQWIALLTQASAEHRTQPRVVVNKVIEQLKAQIAADPEASPLYAPFKKMPAGITDADKARLTAAARTAIQTVANPALERFEKFFREVYLPASRDTVGLYDTPDGELFYRNRIKYYTTIDNMDAAAIYNRGLDEVKRIRAEMDKTLEGINFLGSLDQFLGFIRTDPRFFYKNSDELFAAYQKTARGIEPQLPKLFGHLPKSSFDIKPIPARARRPPPRLTTSRARSMAAARACST